MVGVARVSKVYETSEGFKFAILRDKVGEVKNDSKSGAVKSRARIIKAMKAQGIKVLCQ